MSERWDQVKEILALALEQELGERGSFIRKACGEDEGLRAEIESLAAHCNSADSVLENSPASNLLSIQPDRIIGRRLGAYRVVRAIGHGGMAVVYLGERDDDNFRKSVAIKMVMPGPNSEEIFRRFRNERQALAAIDHPNIVKLLDGGSTEEGLPYLVMDYVDGMPIDQYCDVHRLSIKERLQLFRTVCSAVQYAHDQLIIHRDLKPGNILITKHGIPRLLDFGIAKLLNPEFFHTALITQTNWRPMTPEYASPEQVRGQSVTNASDVYSLGVLLYELLTGHRAYRASAQSLLEVERSICEEEAEKPSAVVGKIEFQTPRDGAMRTAITSEVVSANRCLDPAGLRRRLHGDLDTIVMKALRKPPQDRYASVAEFSNDIERHLSGTPVAARKRTIADRSAKFLRRHRESLATALVFLLVMACLIAWGTRGMWQAAFRQGPGVTQSDARASVAVLGFKNLSGRPDTAWISTALSEMLAGELGAGEKLRTVPSETVARAKADLSLLDAESLSADTLARLRANLGSDFVVLGSYLDLGKASGGQIRLDLRLQDTAKGETVAAISQTSSEVEILDLVSRTGRQLREQLGVSKVSPFEATGVRASVPSNPDAMRFYAEGLDKLRVFDALSARDVLNRAAAADPSYPLVHSALARAWMRLGYNQNAIDEARKALDLAGKLSRENHALIEARYYEATKNWENAIETYRSLFSFFPDSLEYGLYLANAQVGGERANDALTTIAQLRSLSREAKEDPRIDLAEAEAAYLLSDNRRVVAAAETTIKKANTAGARLVAARARLLQCRALASLGQPQRSMAAGADAGRIYHEAGDLGGEAQAFHATAEIPLNQGDLKLAKTLYQQALAIARKIGDKRATARELGNIGLIFAQEGDFATGEKIYGEALADFRDVGDKHGMSVVIGNTGDIFHAEGRLGDALAEYRDALVLAREVGHKSSEGIDLQLIGNVLGDQGDLRGAVEMYERASEIQREIDDTSYYAATLVSIGRLRRQRGDSDGAKKAFQESLALRERLGEKGTAAETQVALAELACDSSQPAQAEKLAAGAVHEFQVEHEADNELMAETVLLRSLLQQGRLDDARKAAALGNALHEKSKDVTIRLPFALESAYAKAAVEDLAGAERLAREVTDEANQLGLVRVQLEASLAIAEIQQKGRNPAQGRVHLAKLANDARAKGFELIARQASAAASSRVLE
ncbi:MAG: protein kinase domain-containing protein [Terriglobales bacterium]